MFNFYLYLILIYKFFAYELIQSFYLLTNYLY